MTARHGLAARGVLSLLRAYQRWVSPLFAPHCRYYPSCSSYAVTAVTEYGALRGSWLAIRRLSRCHPWHAGGIDPVPANPDRAEATGADSNQGRRTRWAS